MKRHWWQGKHDYEHCGQADTILAAFVVVFLFVVSAVMIYEGHAR